MTTTTASRNGASADTSVTFPLDSFKDAAIHLRRPFTVEAVKFKVQAIYGRDEGRKAIVVAYIDARLAVERLNLIVPHLWWDHYERDDRGYRCLLTVDGIVREDIGEGFGKAGYSDALKRAAVKFGIGVSLYAIPQTHLALTDRHLRTHKDTLVMTAQGERQVRDRYRGWLAAQGTEAFGEPLSHGDVEGAQGDVEADDSPVHEDHDQTSPEALNSPDPGPFLLADTIVDEIVAAWKATGNTEHEWMRGQLVGVGLENVPAGRVTKAVLRQLTDHQAMRLLEALEAVTETSA